MKTFTLRVDLRIALLYALFGGIWIIITDRLLASLITDVSVLTTFQTYKGWVFVAISALLIYTLLRRELILREITESKFLESQDRYRLLFETSTDAFLLTAPDGSIYAANPAACRMFGWTEEELKKLGRGGVVDQDDPRLSTILEERARKGYFRGELTFIRRDGTKFPGEISTAMFMNKQGSVQTSVVIRDITERVQAEEKLHDSQLRLAGIIDSAMDAIISLDANQDIIIFNPAAEKLFLCSAGEAIGQPLDRFIPEHFREMHREHVHTFGETSQTSRSMAVLGPLTCLRANGDEFPAEITISQAEMAGQKIYTAILRDISARVQAENALRESEEKYRSLFENVMNGFALHEIVLNGEGKPIDYIFLEVNDAFEQMTGLERENILGKKVTQVIPGIENDPADWIGRYGEVALTGKEIRFEQRAQAMNKWYSVLAFSSQEGQFATIFEDITERREAENILRKTQEQLMLAIRSANVGLWNWDLQSNEIYYSPEWKHQLGYEDHEVSNDLSEWERRVHPEDLERAKETTSTFLDTPYPNYNNEFRMRHKDGSYRWIFAQASLVNDEQGEPIRMIGSHIDITESKRAEEKLLESEQRFRHLFMASPDAVMVIDPSDPDIDWPIVDCNEIACQMNGYTREELVGKSINILNVLMGTPEERADYLESIKREGVLHLETSHRHHDGHTFPIETSTSIITFEGRELVLGIDRDITMRKQAEEKLRESEKKYKDLINGMNDTVWVIDFDTTILDVNNAASDVLGYARDELLSMKISDIDVELTSEQILNLASNMPRDEFQIFETWHTTKDGRNLPVEISSSLVSYEGNPAIISIARDITERKQAEQTLRESEAALRKAQQVAHVGSWVWHIPENRIEWSDEMYRIFSIDQETFSGNLADVIAQTVHPDDRAAIEQSNLSVIENKNPVPLEYRIIRPDGSVRTVWGEAGELVMDDSGQPIKLTGIVQDITERKQAEKRMRRQLQRLRALNDIDRAINSSLDMHISLDVLLREVLSQLNVDAAAVLLLNPSTQVLEFKAGKGFRSPAIQQSRVRLGEGAAGKVGMEHQMLHIPNLAEASHQFTRAELLSRDEFVEYFAVSLVAKGVLKGVLEIYHRSPLNVDVEWESYLETLGGQAAIAIDNAQLFEKMQKSNMELIMAYDATITGWSRAMDLHDEETEGHSQRVTELTLKLAEKFGISRREQVHIQRGALLHDIGKLGVPDRILFKPGSLIKEEWEIMRQHPKYAYEMLMPIAYLRPALDIPFCHHEKWDGSGYPRGLKGEQIPLAARIFAVVDVWDALRSDRPYREKWSKEKTLKYIREQSGKHFDPEVVEAFLSMIENE